MKDRRTGRRVLLAVCVLLAILAGAIAVYVSSSYRAVGVQAALASDGNVTVTDSGQVIAFDGPGTDTAMVFYPGGKVQAEAYAPLLHELAEQGIDGFLVRMPLNLAVLAPERACEVHEADGYPTRLLGGHSLGGAMAAACAGKHPDDWDGVVLLAAYPANDLSATALRVLTVYGSRDGVLSIEKLEAARKLLPNDSVELVIEGGNHALFGSYGPQKGDGEATISSEEQLRLTVEAITKRFGGEMTR